MDSIPVALHVEDVDPENLVALDQDFSPARFGGPLHPVIQRYTRGDVPAPLTLEYTVCGLGNWQEFLFQSMCTIPFQYSGFVYPFHSSPDLFHVCHSDFVYSITLFHSPQIGSNVNCSSGDPAVCEGSYELMVEELEGEPGMLAGGNLVLSSSNEFGYRVSATNVGADTAVSPALILRLPQQTRLSRTVCWIGQVVDKAGHISFQLWYQLSPNVFRIIPRIKHFHPPLPLTHPLTHRNPQSPAIPA